MKKKRKSLLIAGLSLGLLTWPMVESTALGRNSDNQLSNEDIQKIQDVYQSIQDNYIEDTDKDTLLQGALEGMVNALGDPYSEFLDAAESEVFDDSIEGSFFGIGVHFVLQNGNVMIISPIADTPADKAGLQPNDIILEADGTSLADLDTNQVVTLIRGEEGSKVKLKIQRGSSTFEVEVERAKIPITTVTSKLDEEEREVGYIEISQFSATTYDELVQAITALREEGAKRFVFDLRNNPGGLLDQALRISNIFLEDGQVILQTQAKGEEAQKAEADDATLGKFQVTEPYVVLVNKGSASASEILAAAIQENTNNPIIGVTSFGKGTVQNIANQSELGELKLTIAKWLTPNGTWIHGTGVTPDVEASPHELASAVQLLVEEPLKEGEANEKVNTAIQFLRTLGYEIDGDYQFSDQVSQAVKDFQKDKQLDETGEIDSLTATQLNQAIRDYLKEVDPQYDKALELVKEME